MSQQTHFKKTCTHDGAKPVLQIGKCTVVAGNAWDINDALDELQPDVLLSVGGRDLATTAKEQMVTFDAYTTKNFTETFKMTPKRWKPKGTILIDWPDMGAPPMDRAWWDALYEDLGNFDGTVAVFCMGGHGRTGTTLAILAAIGGVNGTGDPVDWVRDNWCMDAVESEAQCKYLFELGIISDAFPSKDMSKGMNQYHMLADADFGDVGLDPDDIEALTKELECDVCLEKGAKFDKDESMWLCKECRSERAFIRDGKTPEDVKTESDPETNFCKDCNSSPAFWNKTWQQFFCDPCMPLPNQKVVKQFPHQ